MAHKQHTTYIHVFYINIPTHYARKKDTVYGERMKTKKNRYNNQILFYSKQQKIGQQVFKF